MLQVFCDGLYEPRYREDGWSCWAYVVLDEDFKTVHFDKGCIGRGRAKFSANVAEYHAVGHAMRWLTDHKHDAVVYTDSQLVVHQVNELWAVNAEHLRPLCSRIQELMEGTKIRVEWIPREQNQLADDLVNEAYEEARA